MKATWGDCYCADENYIPAVGNPFITALTTEQIFEVFAGIGVGMQFTGANCRDALNMKYTKQWTCMKK
jgi:hypothetical protein